MLGQSNPFPGPLCDTFPIWAILLGGNIQQGKCAQDPYHIISCQSSVTVCITLLLTCWSSMPGRWKQYLQRQVGAGLLRGRVQLSQPTIGAAGQRWRLDQRHLRFEMPSLNKGRIIPANQCIDDGSLNATADCMTGFNELNAGRQAWYIAWQLESNVLPSNKRVIFLYSQGEVSKNFAKVQTSSCINCIHIPTT